MSELSSCIPFYNQQGPLMVHERQSALPADGQYHVGPEFEWGEI